MSLHETRMNNNKVENKKATSWPLSFQMSIPESLGIEVESYLIIVLEKVALNVCYRTQRPAVLWFQL